MRINTTFIALTKHLILDIIYYEFKKIKWLFEKSNISTKGDFTDEDGENEFHPY